MVIRPINPTVLIVDDESNNVDFHVRALRKHYDVRAFTDPEEALDSVSAGATVLLLTDFRMPKLTGLELLRQIRRKGAQCGAIIVTAYLENEEMNAARQVGEAFRVVRKPVEAQELVQHVEEAIIAFFQSSLQRPYKGPS